MTLASVSATIASNGLGTPQALDLPPAFVGCCSSGTAATPSLVSNATQLVADYGYGPLCEAVAKQLALGGGPVVVCKATSQTAGALTGLTGGETAAPSSSGATPMTCAVTGTPRDAYDVKVKVTRAGATLQAVTAMVRVSLDGGTTYGAETPVPSSGAIVIPNTGVTITFDDDSDTLQLYADNIYSFGSTPPLFDATGLGTALAALAAERTTLDHEFVHVVGPINATTYATVETSHDALIAASLPRWFLTEARDQSSGESVATWVGILQGADPGFLGLSADLIAVCPAYSTQTSELMATTWRRPTARLLTPRFSTIPVGQHPGRVRTGPIQGIVTQHHDFAATALQSLDARGFLGVQSIQGREGYYATDRTSAAIGSDFTQIMRARVMCFAARVAIAEATNYVNETVRTVTGGFIDPIDADAFDAQMTSKLTAEVVTPGYASAVAVTVNRTDVITTTSTLRFQVRLRPLGYATTITLDLGFSVTLGS